MTSSSDEKLERARELAADHVINCPKTPDGDAEVPRITRGRGADLAVEVGGPATSNKTLNAVRFDRRISLMGILTGYEGTSARG